MSTKVFISWSGDLSRQLAEAVRNWLPGVLQYVKPYFTPDDIEKGTKWSTEIIKELEVSEVGILCLTKDNLDKPWILFEAGALSKNFGKSKVCILLFGIDSSDLSGPLTGFQDTKFNKTDFKRLIESINNEGGESKLDSKILDDVFEMWWERLEKQVNSILEGHKSVDHTPTRSDRAILEEILDLSRMKASMPIRRDRYSPSIARSMSEIIDVIDMYSMENGDETSYRILKRLRIPIKKISREIDDPELYEKYIYRFKRNSSQQYLFEDDDKSPK